MNLYKKSKNILPFSVIHPEMAQKEPSSVYNLIEKNHKIITGIGEIGLDRTYIDSDDEWNVQKEIFSKQLSLAEKFNKPILCLIDTPGAYPGIEAEERGQGEAIARNLYEMMKLNVPVICIIIGEGASGGALGIGIGDRVLMLENTWYSVISPESCSSILWGSWDYKEQAAESLKLTAKHDQL